MITVAAFVLSLFIKQLPLRETVATAGVSEAFASPKPPASLDEVEREMSVLNRRQAGRLMIERVAQRAGIDLPVGQCWVLGQVGHHPDNDAAHLGARHDIPAERIQLGLDALRQHGMVEDHGGAWELTAAGTKTLERLRAAARARLEEMLDGWQPGEHRELGDLITRLGSEFLVDTHRVGELLESPPQPVGAGA